MGGFAFTSQINKGRCQSARQEGLLYVFKLLVLCNKTWCRYRGKRKTNSSKSILEGLLQIPIFKYFNGMSMHFSLTANLQGHFSTYGNLPLYHCYVTEHTCWLGCSIMYWTGARQILYTNSPDSTHVTVYRDLGNKGLWLQLYGPLFLLLQ